MPVPVEFWFDFASTYSYVAAMRVEAAAAAAGVPLLYRPFLLGPIFAKQGWNDSPYNLNPARGRYMWRDIERLCTTHGLPFRRPSRFPRNPVLAARVARAASEESWLPAYIRAVFVANFGEDRDIADEALIGGILDTLGRDGRRTLSAALDAEQRGRLREQTDSAWKIGIVGAPTFVVNGELFWGQDRMDEAFAWGRS